MRREGEWSINDKLKQEDTNPDLFPMLKGAWLVGVYQHCMDAEFCQILSCVSLH